LKDCEGVSRFLKVEKEETYTNRGVVWERDLLRGWGRRKKSEREAIGLRRK
jgi:hypothetical protein